MGLVWASRGFTLIEILVAMVILGILTTGVVLSLPDTAAERQQKGMRTIMAQAEAAALRAEAEASPWAWEVSAVGARLWRHTGKEWVPADDRLGTQHAWPAEFRLDRLEVEGRIRAAGSRIIFAGDPPIFEIHLVGNGRRWRLSGRPDGTVSLEEGV